MSEWINANIAKPPESHSVLLYVVRFQDGTKDILDDHIIVGFYGDKDWYRSGFYQELIDDDGSLSYRLITESEFLKVIAWTLRPRKPYKSLMENKEWEG